MPNSGPFLHETQDQAWVQGTVTEILIMCPRTVYYCGYRGVAEILIFLTVAFVHLIKYKSNRVGHMRHQKKGFQERLVPHRS